MDDETPMDRNKRLAVCIAVLTIGAVITLISNTRTSDLPLRQNDSVFATPRLQREVAQLQPQVTQAFANNNFLRAEALSRAIIARLPGDAAGYYNLACAQARMGQPEKAIRNLTRSVDLGFRDVSHLKQDDDLVSLHPHKRWPAILQRAAGPAQRTPHRRIVAGGIQNNVAMVEENNTAWDASKRRFNVFFDMSKHRVRQQRPVATEDDADEVARRLNKWHKEGSAAGLGSVLYDNHDRDHSNIDLARFPGLARIEYSAAASHENLNNGLQHLSLIHI